MNHRNAVSLAALVASLAAAPGAFAAGTDGGAMRLAQAGQPAGADAADGQATPDTGADTAGSHATQDTGADASRVQIQPAPQNQAQGGRQNQQAAGGQDPNAPVLLVVPLQAEQQTAANGCWARLYDGRNFTGSQLTLMGPVDLREVNVPGRLGWAGFDSAVVGPKARVVTFDDENFEDQTAVLNPGQRIPDLNERKLGWFEEIESVQVRCTQ